MFKNKFQTEYWHSVFYKIKLDIITSVCLVTVYLFYRFLTDFSNFLTEFPDFVTDFHDLLTDFPNFLNDFPNILTDFLIL